MEIFYHHRPQWLKAHGNVCNGTQLLQLQYCIQYMCFSVILVVIAEQAAVYILHYAAWTDI